ncbi:dead deah box helicase domain-containing protein [Cyclospora cayetanensis]|uniref:Dead deah box helicase domain-containing protein n=1 Tax=Cyclospora cayetanensis TaxID=88456 RepID=A0A1D3D0S0_9EIME|nr:dead deah box helicase domain-containing protein [Cyclospora cayetanensis]
MREYFVSLIRDTKEVSLAVFADLQEQLQESPRTWAEDLPLFAPLPALQSVAEASKSKAVKSKYAGCLTSIRNRDVFPKAYLDAEASDLLLALRVWGLVICVLLLLQKLLSLCRTLQTRQLLPCLIFNFSRPQVRRMGMSLSRLLEDLQWAKYYGTEEATYRTRALNKQRLEQYEAMVQERDLARRMRGMSRQQREAQGLDRQDLAALEEDDELPPPPGDIADEIDEEFSFANPKAMGTNFDDIKGVLKDVQNRANSKQDELLAQLLARGVGLFDDGLSKVYRVAVELLYRWGFLRIIICTHALALGMNLPCRSAVFAGDALALTPTMFKQASSSCRFAARREDSCAGGRAGRRGYDSAGHIIFWEVPFRRINRLLEARLPVFSGDFPVTPMLVLRTLRLNSQLASTATELQLEDRLNRLYLNPLFSVSGSNHLPSERELQILRFYIRYHVRFTADLLLRAGVLSRFSLATNDECALNVFGYIAELLYENGRGALLLHFLLLAGTLEALCVQEHLSQTEREQLLLQVLAICCDPSNSSEIPSNFVLQQVLQHRREVSRYRILQYASATNDAAALGAAVAASQQTRADLRPFTQRFPRPLEEAVEAFNRLALSTTAACLRAATTTLSQRANLTAEDYQLPLTGLAFASSAPDACSEAEQREHATGSDGDEGCQKPLLTSYRETVQQCCLQSPFAAMSCLQDSQVSLSSEMLQDSLRMHLPFQPEVMCAMCPLEVQRFPVFDPAAGRTTFVEVYRKNSYLRDLYLHGKLTRVVSENGIAPESLWKLLHHFVGSLRHLQEGLQVLELQDGTAGAHLALSVARLHARMKEVLVEESA